MNVSIRDIICLISGKL